MPSPLTSSFATAAANSNQDGRRGDAGGDWARNRANGATQTFRRPSLATNVSNSRESNHVGQGIATPTSSVYVPPHLNASYQGNSLRNGTLGELRYTKDQLVALYKQQRDAGALDQNLPDVFTGGWNPLDSRDSANSAWGKRDDTKESSVGPEICWDHSARTEPLALIHMSDEEKELFSSSVNSSIKPPQNASKDNNGSTTLGRKTSTSISQNHAGPFNTASPGTGRPGPRRRDTSDSYNGNNPLSPTGGGRFFRDEPSAAMPPASLLRRKTDYKEGGDDLKSEQPEKDAVPRDAREETSSPFGSLKRNATGPLSAGLNAPSSPWAVGPPSAGFGSMGTFGSFALGPSSAATDVPEQRSGFGSLRGESRFKGLLSKTSLEDMSPAVKEKPSTANLGRLSEVENDGSYQPWDESLRTRPGRSDTNPYGDDVPRSGSAALGGAQDNVQGIDQLGFSTFGLPPNTGSRDFMQSSAGQDPAYHQTPQHRQRGQEPMSPTNTNPYQSPEADRRDTAEQDQDGNLMQQRGNIGFAGREEPGINAFGSLRRGVSSAMEDRSQTSSTGPNRGFGGLGGLGGFPGFGSSAWSGVTSAPNKDRGFPSGFADPVFGMGDLQAPSVPGLSSNSFFGSPPVQSTAAGRPSKVSAIFPQAMQEQAQGEKAGGEGLDRLADFATRSREISGLDGGFGRREQEAPLRGGGNFYGDTSSHDTTMRPGQGTEDSGVAEGLGSLSHLSGFGSSQNLNTNSGVGQGTTITGTADVVVPGGQNQSQSSGSPASSQLPAPQQRQMVMPDRMRWIYRDPSGTTQGPWSGLEMHDWFKAGFFTAELQVKKLEDADYEPLAQLVRRIGNSREPFLVPQIGVPHGPSAPSQGNHWAAPSGSSAVGAGPPQPGAAQPPFASSFPSFGTTLTAEQQNALERRKQEEQYLMARQKEHLAQQQVLLKQMQLQGGPQALHSLQHHSSAHSLHSQPSFGSITSPSGYQPSPIQGPIQPPQNGPGFMESTLRHAHSAQFGADFRSGREEDLPNLLDRMNVSRGAPFPFTSGPFGQHQDNGQPPPQLASMLQDRARLQMEQQQADVNSQNEAFRDNQVFSGRLQEFNALRAQIDDSEMATRQESMALPSVSMPGQPINEQQVKQEQREASNEPQQASQDPEALSLSQQVQKTVGQQRAFAADESAWIKTDQGLPPFLPPPPTASPLPAPSAQRNRQNVADNLAVESRSQTQTPVDTPSTSIAPWAEKTSESAKGPSLKQIQEAEARKAAQREEIAAAARKAQAEQERMSQPVPPAPGLPSTSTWANAGTPTTPTTPGTNVWAKPAVGKPSSTAANAATKKTLAQIQREEEARKQRQAAAANQQITNAAPIAAGGKRYADLASKAATVPAAPSPPASAWTTVGSSGKAKAPTTVVATPQISGRTVSGTTAPSAVAAPPAARSRPSVQTRVSTTGNNQNKATDEFTRWAKSALGKGLNGNINVDDFVQSLLLLPSETEIISDSIYANSQTLDGRRFADEFVRRRKLADKGVLQDGSGTPGSAATAAAGAGEGGGKALGMGAGVAAAGNGGAGAGVGGWSEVAKKGPAGAGGKDEAGSAAFKVVATKKKGKR